MSIASVAVIGIGQIGGSLAMALRNAVPRLEIKGIDVSAKRLRLLKNVLSHGSKNVAEAANSDLIFVCLHFRETLKYLASAPRGALIVDVCSAKRKVMAFANRRRLRFIGGHPMTGNERAAEKGWDAGLFRDHPFFLCPSSHVSKRDLNEVRALLRKMKAKPVVVDPSEHDRAVALTSHLPAFLSLAYRQFAQSVPEIFRGPGYRSFTRLGNTPSDLLSTFLESNGDFIEQSLRSWKKRL